MSPPEIDALFKAHYDDTLGWKHGCAPSAEQLKRQPRGRLRTVLFVAVTVSPYSWLLKMHDGVHRGRHHHRGERPATLLEFLRSPWPTLSRDNLKACRRDNEAAGAIDGGTRSLPSPAALYNRKLASYARLADAASLCPHVALVRYEDVVRDPAAFVAALSRRFRVRKRDKFHNVLPGTGDSNGYEFHRVATLKESWAAAWDRDPLALRVANRMLDAQLMRHLGYPRHDRPPEAPALRGQDEVEMHLRNVSEVLEGYRESPPCVACR